MVSIGKLLAFIDGYKRVIVIASYLLAGLAHAAGWGDHAPSLAPIFAVLGWDGLGVPVGPTAQAGFALWAIYDGVQKARKARAQQEG